MVPSCQFQEPRRVPLLSLSILLLLLSLSLSLLYFFSFSLISFHLFSFSLISSSETHLPLFLFFSRFKRTSPFSLGKTFLIFLFLFTIFTSSTLFNKDYKKTMFPFLHFFYLNIFTCKHLRHYLGFLCVCVFGVTSNSVWYEKYAFYLFIYNLIISVFSLCCAALYL